MIIYLASTNPGKLNEFRPAARAGGIDVELLPGIGRLPPCVEDGKTFEENARKKALHYGQYSNGFVFADDSGICVDALEGAPGIFSARFAGEGASDEENNRKLLRELRANSALNRPALNRAAHYICVIALAHLGKILTVAEGRADGEILEPPRGAGGFGYDPLFFFPPLGKTFAELDGEAKLAVSHRGAAFGKVMEFLARFQSPVL